MRRLISFSPFSSPCPRPPRRRRDPHARARPPGGRLAHQGGRAGDVTPATAGLAVVVSVSGADVGTATTDAAGHFSVPFAVTRGGAVVARLAASPAASPAVALAVSPLVKLRIRSAVAFRGATVDVRVQPSTWTGRVLARTEIGDKGAGARRVRIRRARRASSSPRRRSDACASSSRCRRSGPTPRPPRSAASRRPAGGSRRATRAPTCACVLRGLAKLGFHTPGISSTPLAAGHRLDRRLPEGLQAAAHLRVRRRRLGAGSPKARRIRPRFKGAEAAHRDRQDAPDPARRRGRAASCTSSRPPPARPATRRRATGRSAGRHRPRRPGWARRSSTGR